MARPKGFKMTEEHKAKLLEGRKRAKEARIANGEPVRQLRQSSPVEITLLNGKPVVYISGKEKNAFDFYEPVRNGFRAIKDMLTAPKVLKGITDKVFWINVDWIKEHLKRYVTLVVRETTDEKVKEPKERKPRSPMTAEHKAKLVEALKRAREVRQKNREGQ